MKLKKFINYCRFIVQETGGHWDVKAMNDRYIDGSNRLNLDLMVGRKYIDSVITIKETSNLLYVGMNNPPKRKCRSNKHPIYKCMHTAAINENDILIYDYVKNKIIYLCGRYQLLENHIVLLVDDIINLSYLFIDS